MKKIKFNVGTNYVGCEYSEIVEYDDDVTEYEIEKDFEVWVWEHINACWEEIK